MREFNFRSLILHSFASYLLIVAPCSEFAMNLMASLPEIAYDDAEDEEEPANGGDGDGSVTLQVGLGEED